MALHLTEPGLNFDRISKLIKLSVSAEWETETRSCQRLLKHLNMFGYTGLGFALAFILFYFFLKIHHLEYRCMMWTLNITAVGMELYPWAGALFNRSETLVTIVFTLLACGLYLSFFFRLGLFSELGQDDHRSRARRVFDGLLTITGLQKCKSIEYKCIRQWAINALGIDCLSDTEGRRKWGRDANWVNRFRLPQLTFHLLHAPFSLLMSLPKLGYTVSQNVESSGGLLALCNSSILVVVVSLLMEAVLLRPITYQIVRLREGNTIPDELAFNQSYVGSQFVTLFLSNVFWPTLLTFLLDENW